MTMLAIDCGNTRIKWARFDAGQRYGEGDVELKGDADPYAVLAGALAASVDSVDQDNPVNEIDAVNEVNLIAKTDPVNGVSFSDRKQTVYVSNVAGKVVAERIAATVKSALGVEAEFVAVRPKAYGIECAYRNPETLGVDRWLAMIAARRLVNGPFAVICAGTAVTFDAVDAGSRHVGGLIFPGDRLMIEAMAENTNQIPVVAQAGQAVSGLELLGRSTAEAVGHGTRLALAAGVDRAIDTVADVLGTDLSVVVTGGDGSVLSKWLASRASVRADLVLDGLAAVAADEE